MSTDITYTAAVSEFGERMARMEGKLDTGLAEVTGAVNTLNQSIRNSDRARLTEATEVRKDLADHEERIRRHDRDITAVATRTAHVEATAVTPRQLWGAVFSAIGGAGGLVFLWNTVANALATNQ